MLPIETWSKGSLDVMNFLNEVVMAYPAAISFGPGRPLTSPPEVRAALEHVASYADAISPGSDEDVTYRRLGQYGETNGFIREEIARFLRVDEGLDFAPSDIVVTVGCQEAMLMLAMAMFDRSRDVLLISDPAYVGMTGPATLLGVPLHPVPQSLEGLDPSDVDAAAKAVRAQGRVPRALYHVPTFNNPLGTVMTLDARRRLLDVATDHGFYIFEDNTYGAFAYDEESPPTLAKLDREGRVIYLGSFSKLLFPGLRVGFLAHRAAGPSNDLVSALGRIKSFTTVNTPSLMQAVVAGVLRKHGYSLRSILEPKRALYRRNRDQILESLERHLPGESGGVDWNRPRGGFFLTLRLPFEFDNECLRICAEQHGVICTPMRYFTSTPLWNNAARLSFSCLTPQQIETGIGALSRFIESHRELQ